MRFIFFCVCYLSVVTSVFAQDSLPPPAILASDSVKYGVSVSLLSAQITFDSVRSAVIRKSFLQCYNKGWFFLQKERVEVGKDQIFYAVIILLLAFGILRVSFSRYTADMFRFYFQSTLRIQQIKEQLSLGVLAGTLYSLLFIFGVGLYLYLLSVYYHLSFRISSYQLLYISPLILLFIYVCKYLILSFIGWAFQLLKAVRLYLFITFLTNKIMGILLLPFLVTIAFGSGYLQNLAVNFSIALVISLFIFRFFRAYHPLSDEFRIGFFQYLAFLISAEIAPLLLIYKLLMQFL
ncbi:MAG: DUF4271 domain-containing protein [Bacteroidota bacterium]